MTNEKKAKHLASREMYGGFTLAEQNAAYQAAMEAMEWKDEQEIEFLQSLLFQSATYHIFDRINDRIKLLKGE